MEKRNTLIRPAKAGSLESNDILIFIAPGEGIEIDLESVVLQQFGDQIRAVIETTLADHGVTDCRILAKDKGALDVTIRARTRTAIMRGCEAHGL